MNAASQRTGVRTLLATSLHGRGPELRRLVLWSLVEAVPAFLFGRLVAQAIDDGFLAGSTTTGLAWLGVLGVSVGAGAWATRQTYLRLAGLVEPFRDEMVRLTVTGALARSTVPGSSPDTAAVARLTQQVEIVREAYGSTLMVVQGFLVTAVSALLGLLTLAPALLALVLPPLVIGLALFVAALSRMAARQRAYILADERIATTASALAGGLRDIVACGGEETVRAGVGEHIDAQANAMRELARFTAVRTVAVALGGLLPLVLVLVAAPWLLDHGLTTGGLLGALAYISQGVHPALQSLVRGVGNTGLWLLVTLGRIVEATHVESPEGGEAPRLDDSAPAGHDLRLSNVTFGYGRSPDPIVHDLDLAVPDGDHLAVVGPSGVGKSTLANLIAGILAPQEGEIRIGDVPVRGLGPRAAAGHRVLIPQEAYVFAGTLRENLGYLRDYAAESELDDAVDRLGIRPLVQRLGGYDAVVRPEGLSAGERQLITLGRAYLSPARLVVLDEATCYLDATAEARVEQAFAARPGSLLVIAHRISSALRARRILVMDGAQVLLGSHEELLARSVLYRDLVGHWRSGGGEPEQPGRLSALWAVLRERVRGSP